MLRMLFTATCIVAQTAVAQLGVPAVRLPALPPLQVPQAVNTAVPGGADALNSRELTALRHLRIRDLLRTHGAVIEPDPRGAPIIRNEVLVFSPRDEALAAARAAGFTIARERALEGIDARIVVLQVPAGVSTARALGRLRALDPQGLYDFNHIYMDSGMSATETQPSANEGQPAQRDIGGARLKLGLIDGGVAVTHAVFRDVSIRQHGCADHPVPSAHATAVASLMVGSSEQFHGSAPGAELYAADVYCGLPAGGAVDAVADAFSWLAREQVPVINVSLVGPPNLMLENVVRRVVAQGDIVVAAVGNDGPAAAPLYPASYADVVGVTAVDSRDRVLAEAARGTQVAFAAPGADMAAASEKETFAIVRGTSFAAPIVAGLLAARARALDKASADEAIADLVRHAVDLGAPGRDPVYGNGLVGASLRPAAALAMPRSSRVQN
jgi:subtilisin family serine protease